MSLSEEEGFTRTCFESGSSKRQERSGQGCHILRLLHAQGGFLRLRTGRLSFFMDFSKDLGQVPDDKEEYLRHYLTYQHARLA